MRAPPSPDRHPRRRAPLGRLAVAALGGLVVLFAGPAAQTSSPAVVSDVLGSLATPAATSQPDAGPVAAVEGHARTRRSAPGVSGARLPEGPPAPQTLIGYAWPIRNARLTLPFGPTEWGSRVVDGELFHDGIDLATFCGDRVRAAHAGVILAAGRHYDEFIGWVGDLAAYEDRLDAKGLWPTLPIVVVIDDGNGYRSMYAHFGKIVVSPGDVVEAGDLIGYEGRTGRATGCHLHYGLFSPIETATFGLDPVAAEHMLLPSEMVARIDPLLVLPPLDAAGIH
ncbi:MAG: M23 family metallopeptidase [Chloroflexota bacterium]